MTPEKPILTAPVHDSQKRSAAPGNAGLPPTTTESYAALLESIVYSSDDAIITKDLNSIITSWNPAATAIFGYEPEEIIGHSILRLIPERLHHEETEIITRLRAGEKIAHFETTRLRRDGEEIPVSLTISPLRNAAGEVIGASKIARNIAQQRSLDNAHLHLAAIVESSDDAILSKDLNSIITSWNRAAERLFGYTEEEIVGRSILTLIPKHLHYQEPGIIAKLIAGQRIEHFETTRLRKDGQTIEVSITISPVLDGKGNVMGASKIVRDITERKRMEQSLLQAEKLAATGRMAASIAHEINNPLEGLLNLIYLARTSADDPMQVRSLLETAEGELDRVAHIAKQTLGYYREHSAPTSVALQELIEDSVRVYGPKLRAAKIALETSYGTTKRIHVKRGEMMQVVSNLIANALHAMPGGGTLSVSTDLIVDGEERVLLTIRDTGVGIPAENLERIFEPFFTTRSTIGTGIGLWIARQFIEGYGGNIRVESSTAPDTHGTAMIISLPVDSTDGALLV